MSKRPRPIQRPLTRQLDLATWLKTPGNVTTRQEVYAVAKLIAVKVVQLDRLQQREYRWYRRLWAAVQRLFQPASVVEELKEGSMVAEMATTDGSEQDAPEEQTKQAEVQEGEGGVKVVDRRSRA